MSQSRFQACWEKIRLSPKFACACKPFSKPEGDFKGGFKEGFNAGSKPAFAKKGASLLVNRLRARRREKVGIA